MSLPVIITTVRAAYKKVIDRYNGWQEQQCYESKGGFSAWVYSSDGINSNEN